MINKTNSGEIERLYRQAERIILTDIQLAPQVSIVL